MRNYIYIYDIIIYNNRIYNMKYIFQGALEKKEGVPLPKRLKSTEFCLAHLVIHKTL